MRLTHIFIGILLSIVFSLQLMIVVTDIGAEYNTTMDSEFESIKGNFSVFNDNISSLIGDDILSKAPGGADSANIENAGDQEGSIIKSSYRAITEVPKLFTVFKEIITLISHKLQIPPIFYYTAFTAFIVVVGFMLVSSILRNRF